ncbi:hypothetical protein L6452_21053 [Arctium lappa]|uniref:Uncharacterized protein n=1 Tax=Arctium lappa TaxID=4217 RepID=A0ACB9BC99_ARCLA|nr:hypothetical protein L6452_21053 [Arctium lappa]
MSFISWVNCHFWLSFVTAYTYFFIFFNLHNRARLFMSSPLALDYFCPKISFFILSHLRLESLISDADSIVV